MRRSPHSWGSRPTPRRRHYRPIDRMRTDLQPIAHAKPSLDPRLADEVRMFAEQLVRSWASAAPIRRVLLVGHTDDTGGPDFNLKLGKDRAEAVRV